MKEAFVVVVAAGGVFGGVCCQPVSLPCHLMLWFQTPHVIRRVSVVSKYCSFSKLGLLVNLWTRTPACWRCKISPHPLRTLRSLQGEYDKISDLCAAKANLLENLKQQKMGYVPHSPFGKPLFLFQTAEWCCLFPLERPKSECRGERNPEGEFPFLLLDNLPQILNKFIALFQNVSMPHI